MLHEVLEEHDFTTRDAVALRSLVTTKLAATGYAPEDWAEVLTRGLEAMLAAPLDAGGLTLGAVPRSRRMDELEFVFPVARGAADAVTARALADAFEAHPGGALPTAYASRVRSLRFVPLRGFLKGYIDLVFEHDGRFYVVDYKSNHLGATPADYRPPKLGDAMSHHDYFLQYHLYVLAVHRFLARRHRGYDYERHFGGVYYLFLRGMSPEHPGMGVFADRPPLPRIDAISAALSGAA
jgi:exodeoxyribonuclease V beta subunit